MKSSCSSAFEQVASNDDAGDFWYSTGATAVEFATGSFTTAEIATGLLIRESGGAVLRVELIDDEGTLIPLWTGADPTTGPGDLIFNFDDTADPIQSVRILLAPGVPDQRWLANLATNLARGGVR